MRKKTESRSAQEPANGLPSGDNMNLLTRMLRQYPEQEPPCDLSDLVIARIEPKQLTIWQRLRCWLQMPRIIAVRPLHLASAAVTAVLILAGSLIWLQEPSFREQPFNRPQLITVALTLDDGQARNVSLIGSFNGWRPEGYAMQRKTVKNRWFITIKVPPGTYEYAFLIDGRQVRPDPRAVFFKLDGFGSRNSLLIADEDDALSL